MKKRSGWPWPEGGRFDGRLAVGEYYKPGEGRDVAIVDARQRVLKAIAMSAPEVLVTLQKDVYPAFEAYKIAWEEHYKREMPLRAAKPTERRSPTTVISSDLGGKEEAEAVAGHDNWVKSKKTRARVESGELVLGSSESSQRLANLRYAYCNLAVDWARSFSIDFSWIHDAAVETMSEFAERSKLPAEERSIEDFAPSWGARMSVWSAPLSEQTVAFDVALDVGWCPTSERWADFRVRALKELAEKVDDYGKRICELVEDKGFVRAPSVREPIHFQWLVERLILKRTWGKIADRLPWSSEAVRSGVRSAAESADITMPLEIRP